MRKQPLALLALLASLLLVLVVAVNILYQTGLDWLINVRIGANLGSLLSGLLALPTVLLLWSTLSLQSRSSRQNEIERHFFALIQYHRSNVEQMELTADADSIDIKGKRVFFRLYSEMGQAIAYVRQHMKDMKHSVEDVLTEQETRKLRAAAVIKERDIDLLELTTINIAYLLFFYGVQSDGWKPLNNVLLSFCQKDFVSRQVSLGKEEGQLN